MKVTSRNTALLEYLLPYHNKRTQLTKLPCVSLPTIPSTWAVAQEIKCSKNDLN